MGCITSMAIALWLIALAAGVMLLYKVQKENLQWPFRVGGWLITIVALGGMLCCSLRCMVGSCYSGACQKPPMMMPCYHHRMCAPYGKCGECCKSKCSSHHDESCKEEEECEEENEPKNVNIIIKDSTVQVQKK